MCRVFALVHKWFCTVCTFQNKSLHDATLVRKRKYIFVMVHLQAVVFRPHADLQSVTRMSLVYFVTAVTPLKLLVNT